MIRISLGLVSVASLSLAFAPPASFAASSTALWAGPAAAPAVGQQVAPEKLDTLLGPIALYPDALVLQILECAAKPDEVKKLGDWVKKNPDLKGTAAQDAAAAEGFEPSYVAVVMFPSVVKMMVDQPAWTKDVGKAFTDDRAGVFASLQRLRGQAQAVGNLKSSEQQSVETVKTSSGQDVIVIQPANPEVVYVPQYNPTVVYTQPPPPPPPGQSAAVGLIGFTSGVILGAAIADNNNDCWGYRGGMSNENYEDYAQHRESMASQRGENQGQRQQNRGENQANRQASSSASQAKRQDARGSAQGASAQSAKKAEGGALSGYQNGAKTREASSRGRSSTSGRSSGKSGGSRGGGRGR